MIWISLIQALKHNGLPLQRMCKIFCKGSRSCDSSIKSTWQTSLFLRGVSGKLHWERQAQKPHEKAQQEEGNSQKIHICSSCPYEIPYKRYLIKHVKTHDKEKVYGAPKFCPECGKSFPAKRNLTKHLKIHQSLFSFNMSGYFVVVGDLLVVPLGPFPLDTLINFWLPLDPLPASSLSNYSLPIDFVYNNIDQAFWFYSMTWINDKERFILLFMNWQTTRSPWL